LLVCCWSPGSCRRGARIGYSVPRPALQGRAGNCGNSTASIQIGFRYPPDLQKWYPDPREQHRVGLHNDCFLSGPTDTGTYQVTLTVTDISGNSSTCTAQVTVVEPEPVVPLVIPSGFSPNGDGVADTWIITGAGPNTVLGAQVFNRWGDLIYASDDYRNDWDGACTQGVGPTGMLPDGTYFYIVTIQNGEERVETGYVQIAR